MNEASLIERFQTLSITRRGYYSVPYNKLSPAAKLFRDEHIEETNGEFVPPREKRKNNLYFKQGGIRFFKLGRLNISFSISKKG